MFIASFIFLSFFLHFFFIFFIKHFDTPWLVVPTFSPYDVLASDTFFQGGEKLGYETEAFAVYDVMG